MKHEFIYNGLCSTDYGLTISGEDTWTRPQPDVKRIQVPGRSGDLIQLGHRYQNVDIVYHCGIVSNLRVNFDAFNARLLSDPGYHRLEDSYHPEYYRQAVFESALEPDVKQRGVVGTVDIRLNCKPQLYFKAGEVEQKVLTGGFLYNPTPYTSSPLIRFSFTSSGSGGSITINGRTMSATDIGYTGDFIIDCDRQDIYLAETKVNFNNFFILSDGEFFELHPGRNTIAFTGIMGHIFITPNWWTL